MVATERWPNALYSELSMAVAVSPSCVARSRSTVMKVSTPLSDWSLSMSVNDGSSLSWSASLPVHRRKSLMLSAFSVYW